MAYTYNAEGKLKGVVYPTDAGTNTTPGYNLFLRRLICIEERCVPTA